MICTECKETIEKCDWCDEKFEKGAKILCYDSLHFCCMECLYDYVEYYADNATAIEEGCNNEQD